MKLFEMVFSPTGGTQKVCEILANEFQRETVKINLMNENPSEGKDEIEPDDICLIAVPSFGGRVPVPAAERLKKLKGNHGKAVLVVVFGNRAYDDTLLELKEIAEASDFVCIAAIAAVAEHSIMRQYGSGRPDVRDREELKGYAALILRMLSEGRDLGELTVPGKQPYREYKGLPLHPKAGKACNECGACADICPVGAIRKESPRETDSETCITCMGCVAVCPQNARKLSSVLLAAASNKMKKVCSTRKDNEFMMGTQL